MEETRQKRRRLRRRLAYGATAFLLLLCLCGNLCLFYAFREHNFFGDLTTEGLYTMTSGMTNELAGVTEEVTVTFCADPDICLSNSLMRPVYILAKDLAAAMPNIKVETLSLRRDSHAADAYKTTSTTEIKESDVIVSYGKKQRISGAESFWTKSQEGEYWSFKGEYLLASMILSVTRLHAPVAYFTVGHGETVYDPENPDSADSRSLASFASLLSELALDVKLLDLSLVTEIPEDCAILIMNGPTADYDDSDPYVFGYRSSMEKIDRYLENRGSLLFLKHPSVSPDSLPVLCEYLAEWGIAYDDNIVKELRQDASDHSGRENLTAVYGDRENSPVAYAIYSSVSDLSAAPRMKIPTSSSLSVAYRDKNEITLFDSVTRHVSPVFYSSANAAAYDTEGGLISRSGSYILGLLGVTAYFADDATYSYSYVMALGSTGVLSETYLGSNAYANRDVLAAAIRTMTRTDTYASSDLGSSTDMNSQNYGGKILESDDFVKETTYFYVKDGDKLLTQNKVSSGSGYTYLRTLSPLSDGGRIAYTIFFLLLPVVVVPLLGIVILRRRKHL